MSPRLLRRVAYASFCSLAVMLALGQKKQLDRLEQLANPRE